MYKPYVYFLENKTTGMKYIGAKYAKNSDPSLFWKTYFTTSKHVKKLLDIFGKDDFKFKILKTFNSAYLALQYEYSLTKFAVYRSDYLNLHSTFLGNLSETQYFEIIDKQKKIASFYGNLSKILKVGIHGFSVDEKLEVCSKGGISASKINKELGRAIFDPDVRKRQHETLSKLQVSAYYDPNLRKEICSKGGKHGKFSKYYYEKNGLTENDRIEAQRSRGKRGGPKNKGFMWYNNGVKSIKVGKRQQLMENFEDYLIENNLVKGRLLPVKSTLSNKICINDGIKNFYIYENEFDSSIHIKGRLKSKGNT